MDHGDERDEDDDCGYDFESGDFGGDEQAMRMRTGPPAEDNSHRERPDWPQIERAALARAKHRCEVWVGESPDGRHCGTRCQEKEGLVVRPKPPSGLQIPGASGPLLIVEVLCPRHAGAGLLLGKECLRCAAPVFDHLDDAADHLDGYLYEDGYGLEDAWADAGPLCQYCDHMCGKDD
jgi:hypothetical protein